MKTTVSIHIPKPCNESWAAMNTVDDLHRHCKACDKVLTDFSGMSDTEVVLWFKHSKGKVCGRFAPGQLNRAMALPTERTEKKKYWLNALWLIPFAWGSKDAKAQTTTPEVIRSKPPVSVIIPQAATPVETTTTTTAVEISGTVRDLNGNDPIANCRVYFVHDGKTVSTKTDANGKYTIRLPEGQTTPVRLIFSVPGHRSHSETIQPGEAKNGKLQLNVKYEQYEIMMKGEVGFIINEPEKSRADKSFWQNIRSAFAFGNKNEASHTS